MEINLLPKQSFLEKRLRFLILLMILILIAESLLITKISLDKQQELPALKEEIADLQAQKEQINEIKQWNEAILHKMELSKRFYLYKSFADSVEFLSPDWHGFLTQIFASLPPYAQLTDLEANGNRLDGSLRINDLKDGAYFLNKLSSYPSFSDIRFTKVQPVESSNQLNPGSQTYTLQFTCIITE